MKRIKFLIFCIFMLGISLAAFSQDSQEEIEKAAELEELESAKSDKKVNPIFPKRNNNIIILEGENAVSTNFTTTPILNYSCSGERTIQLSRSTGTSNNTIYYADFVFYVEEEGLYEFWYGGTPPGPSGDLYPSYASPFEYILDDDNPKEIFRERMNMVENYAPSYYWNYVHIIKLTPGQHNLRIQIKEKRRYDNRFFFYLDNIIFIKQSEGKRVLGDDLPQKFPTDLNNRDIDIPFQPIDDYLIYIRDNPEEVKPLVELSMLYTMISDYLNAIKYLKKALSLDPGNQEIQLLMAKNYIWRQDFQKGIEIYQNLLVNDPSKIDLWLEAGKLTGWTGRYKESISIFEQALKAHPDQIDLLVNQGLTLLWANKEEEANRSFTKAKALASENADSLLNLARVFIVNGYPDKAAEIYRQGIKNFPSYLDFYLQLEEVYYSTEKKEAAMKMRENIEASFTESDLLTQYLDLFHVKISLKEKVISEYKDQLEKEPDNLSLRELLAQALFWNGLKEEAINEYLNILTNHAYRSFVDMQKNSFEIMEMLDKCYTLEAYLARMASMAVSKKNDINTQFSLYQKSISNYESYQAKVLKAKEDGKEAPIPDENPIEAIQRHGFKLASIMGDGQKMIDDYKILINDYMADIKTIRNYIEASQAKEEEFQLAIRANNWKWNKAGYYAELKEVADNGLVLANHLLGRIYQFENDIKEGQKELKSIIANNDYAQLNAAYFQSLLWTGNTEEAEKFFTENKEDILSIFPYMSNIEPKLNFVFDPYIDSEGMIEKDTKAQTQRIMAGLNEIIRDIPAQKKSLEDSIKVLMDIIQKNMVHAFYRYEENNITLRNELGDFYLSQSKLDKAIKQYKMVRAIDPFDISALYRLGTVNQWNQNWSESMQLYKQVFAQDPYYENTVSLYNQLANQYADVLSLTSRANGDPSRQSWKSQIDYTKYISSGLTIHGQYEGNYLRYLRPLGYNIDKHSFFYQSIMGGAELNMDLLKLEPVLGGHLLLHPAYYQQEEAGFPDDFDFIEYLTYHDISPLAKVKYTFSPNTSFSLYGTAGVQQYEQTLSYYIDSVFSATADINVFFALNFLPTIPINKSTFSISAKTDYLFDQHLIYNPSFQINLPFMAIGDSLLELALLANASYQDTLTLGELIGTYYYKPNEAFQSWAKLSTKLLLGNKETGGMEFLANLGGGVSIDGLLSQDEGVNRLMLLADGKVSFLDPGFNLYLGTDFSSTFNLDAGGDWDFWSLSIYMGFSTKLKDLLTL